jgi:hypothetical protein
VPADLILFPTTVIGSMHRPQFVRDLLAAHLRKGAPDAEWERRMDAALEACPAMAAANPHRSGAENPATAPH